MKKLAVINDLSGTGRCSLTAALPVISVMGVQACPVPTAVLSSQTGYASYFYEDLTDRMAGYRREWEKLPFTCDGIFAGYMSGPAQIRETEKFLDDFAGPETLVLIDPVMGDNGRVHHMYSPSFAEGMRRLVKRAKAATPNLTEALLLLYDRQGMEEMWHKIADADPEGQKKLCEETGTALREVFGLETAVITGIDAAGDGKEAGIANLIADDRGAQWIVSPKYGGSYSGTGDLFASVLAAGLVQGIPADRCVRLAVSFLEKAIRDTVLEKTDRNEGVCFERYLWELGREVHREIY